MISGDFKGDCKPFLTDLKLGHSTLEKSDSMRVSHGHFFDTMLKKMKHFSLNVKALSMLVPALVMLIYAILNSDIPFE